MLDFPSVPSGLAAIWADGRQFLSAVRFAWPGLLWLSLIPAVLSILAFFAARRHRSALGQVGRPAAVFGLLTRAPTPRRVTRLILFFAWLALVLGAAGPRWGEGDSDGVAVGRDVVVVLDLSRSMLAEDMEKGNPRWQAAVAGARDLVESLRSRGGHRVGLVVFAARPLVVVPLTTDYDHVYAKLGELDGAYPPPETRPLDDSKSGTRIGAALVVAVGSHDARFPGYQDIILISDGHDPVNDREWAVGVSAARKATILVHTVGVGGSQPVPIIVNQRHLEAINEDGVHTQMLTQLHVEVLQSIATEARGFSLDVDDKLPRIGEFYRTKIEPNPMRELTDDALPQPKDRSAWFLGFGLLLLAIGWMRER